MFQVYILQSLKTHRFYTGYCQDLSNRLTEHNSGENKSTRSGIPWRILHTETFTAKADAIRKEASIKKRGARRYLEDIGEILTG